MPRIDDILRIDKIPMTRLEALRCRTRLGLAAIAVLLTTGAVSVAAHPLVNQIKALAWANRFDDAQRLIETNRGHFPNATPEWLAAVSWAARGASFVGRWDLAEKYALEALKGSEALLSSRGLDEDSYLPTALGASIEVLGKSWGRADRPRAISFLKQQRERHLGTSIEGRIQKNHLLLSLEGKPFPKLKTAKSLSGQRLDPTELEGKVVLYYFWAHWCSDCKRQKPILQQLHDEYAERGLAIVGPTRLYGYIAGGRDATPAEELDYLENAYRAVHPVPPWMPIPIGTENFLAFGVSSTPTLVLVDRDNVVRLYNPGDMTYAELKDAIAPLLDLGS